MEYQLLGNPPLEISRLGFGCMSLQNTQDENEKLLHAVQAHGINFFDTADLYDKGMNEVAVGAAFKHRRSSVILATKVGNEWLPDGSGWRWNATKDYIVTAVEKSLQRLQTDYIDLYQLHGGTLDDRIDETIEAFELLQQQGKIRCYGISSIRPNVIREYVQRSKISSVMMQYSVLDRRPEETCLPLLQKNKIGVLARGSLAQGLLINKPIKNYLAHDAGEVAAAAKVIDKLVLPNRSAMQVALRFVLQNKAVSSAVVGLRNMKQLTEAAAVWESPLLTETESMQLQQSVKDIFYDQHR